MHGLSRNWHENGKLSNENTYADGKLNGSSRTWNEYSQLIHEVTYVEGKENILARSWSKYGGHLMRELGPEF